MFYLFKSSSAIICMCQEDLQHLGYQRKTNICNKNGERKQSSLQSITGESKGKVLQSFVQLSSLQSYSVLFADSKRNDLDRTPCENVVWVYTGAI